MSISEPTYKTTLVFDWTYTVWGERKRNKDHPRTIKGKHTMKVSGTMEEIKKQMMDAIRQYGRQRVEDWYWEDKISRDEVELDHIREPTVWTQLEVSDAEIIGDW
jgi:hypothetical protein